MGSMIASPGIIGLMPRYELGFGYIFGPESERSIQAGAVDSLTSPVSLALVYQRTNSTPLASGDELPGWVDVDEDFSNPRARSVVGASLGKGLAEGRLGVGAGVFYDHDISRFGGEVGQLNLSLGLATHLADQLTIAVSTHHLVPYEERLEPLVMGTGIHWALAPGAEVELDMRVLFPGNQEIFLTGSGGLGLSIADILALRAGFERNTWTGEDRLWSGIGLLSDNSSLDLGVGFLVGQQDSARVWAGLSLRIKL
jgi:hypothetical protein